MSYTINTPEGTRDRLFAECLERRQIQDKLISLFRSRGYTEVITPEVEYYDLFVQSGNPIPQEAMLKIIDRSGKIMVMRPDCTTPIARVAATKLKNLPLPQRLYYDQTVFRSGNAHDGGSREIAQCGIEMIGAMGMRADLEMVAMAVDSLRSCGVPRFYIELGHADYYRELIAPTGLSEALQEQVRSCIEGKNYAALNDLLAPLGDRQEYLALKRLPYLFGGVEILDEAETIGGESKVLDYLRQLYSELKQAGYGDCIRFDLGLVHQIDYYTGVVFRGYVDGVGVPVLSGGRYDGLVEMFGRSAGATGFAVDVDALGSSLPAKTPKLDCVIHYEEGCFARAIKALESRPAGTCELSPACTLESSMRLAAEKGARFVLFVTAEGERLVEV